MSKEVFQIIEELDQEDLQTQLALQCAPLLIGIKIANLLIVRNRNAKDVFEMEMSTKEIDKSYKLLSEALMILRKFEAALAVKKIKGKVNSETSVDVDNLIETVDKITDKVLGYSIKLSILREKKE